jgi:nucleoid-associated protein YgaU
VAQGGHLLRRIVWIGAAAILLVAAAIFWVRGIAPRERAAQSEPVVTAPTPPPAALAGAPAAPGSGLPKPSFDVVTVSPQGQAVIAGHAAPGDRVKVLDGGKTLGEVTADSRGDWVLVPSAPIAPGDHQVSVEAVDGKGGPVRRSGGIVALAVKPSTSEASANLAAMVPENANKPAQLLQPEGSQPNGTLSLDTARLDGADRMALSGRAEPGARLNVYAADQLLGTATADAAGKWTLVAPRKATAKGFELRLDQLAADGRVIRRVAAPFTPPSVTSDDGHTYIVRRGNSLWVIARELYGDGVRYTAIYAANRDQIRDPDLIYPGQHFQLPPL